MTNSSVKRILFYLVLIGIFSFSNQFGFRDHAFAQNSKIDSLFMKLKDEDTKNYQEIEEKIWSEWRKSGSTKSDLLLRRGMDAMSRGDFIASVEHLSAAIDYTPNFGSLEYASNCIFLDEKIQFISIRHSTNT